MTEYIKGQEDMSVKSEAPALGWLFLIAMVLHVMLALAFSLLIQKGIDLTKKVFLSMGKRNAEKA